jgi:hypothetical protein
MYQNTHIHTYLSRLFSEGVTEASQVFLRDAHVFQNELVLSNSADMTGGKTIAV